ncbi:MULTISPECIES: hypothetical protein [Planktothrix]|jgi:hypothetical protein|uniref:Uncharacterized protein n=1 Tax=Planktothrix agardhii TaxID=1160 RepID=A0A1J1JIF9_PLAAG|nr:MULTISPECIES: hypothetical protein [Planktothrix]MCF3576801.1 hypothetical protein [Planktothrix agardhii 1812]CUM61155.1 protein of unknown function [Planktothrix agardhii]
MIFWVSTSDHTFERKSRPQVGEGYFSGDTSKLQIAELFQYVVTHAHYPATNSFCTGTDSEENKIARPKELPSTAGSLHKGLYNHPQKT